MEHSCAPSCRVEFAGVADGSIISLRTLREVREGEALSISYVEMEWPTAERRAVLELQYGFQCVCERCHRDDQIRQQQEEREAEAEEAAAAVIDHAEHVEESCSFEPFFPKLIRTAHASS